MPVVKLKMDCVIEGIKRGRNEILKVSDAWFLTNKGCVDRVIQNGEAKKALEEANAQGNDE